MDKETLIIHYFENRLSEEDRQLFNEYLQNDPDFAAEVGFREQLKAGIHLTERRALKEMLQAHEQSHQSTTGFFSWRKLAIAATILAAIAFTWFLLNNNNNSLKEETLYARYFDTYPNIVAPITRSAIPDSNTLVIKSFLLYESGNFTEAATLFEELAQDPSNSYALFYGGICKMQTNQFSDAIQLFNAYIELPENELFFEESNWYKGLCYLRLVQKEQAIETIELVQSIKGKRLGEATELLNSLQ